jgi:predicted DNA-binding transcriptional regulator AlpA
MLHLPTIAPVKLPEGADQLLSVAQVAMMLSCTTNTVRALVRDKHLPPPIRIGGLPRYRMSWVMEVVEQLEANK